MKHLQDIIKEGLLDVEGNETKMDDVVANQVINDPEGKLWKVFDLGRREVGSRYPIKYSDGTLYLQRSLVQCSGYNEEPLSKVIGFPVDHLVVGGGLYLGHHRRFDKIDSNFCKKFTCGAGIKIASNVIKDIDIVIDHSVDGCHTFPSSVGSISFEDVELLENVKVVDFGRFPSLHFMQYKSLPQIKNCDLKHCMRISIYSPFLFDDEIGKVIDDNWMNQGFVHEYNGVETNVKNFKKLVALVNNPKKYGYDTPRAFKSGIKASDVIPWINDIGDKLNQVELSTNNVRLALSKDLKDGGSLISRVFLAETEDGWGITMYKKK